MKDILLTVSQKRILNDSVVELVFAAKEKLPPIRCGQFLHLKVGGAYLLRRPFCIHAFTEQTVTVVFAVVGGGTKQLASCKEGDTLYAVLPIGNGFTLEEKNKTVVLLGGGLGCAPLATVPVLYPDKTYHSYLGFGNKDAVLFEQTFAAFGKTTVATNDGSYGKKGFVTDVLKEDLARVKPDVILTCGPTPMLKAAAKLTLETGIPAYMSGEQRMGCGVGACLVCTCAVKGEDGVHNKRVCVDGPVFKLEEVLL